MLGGRARGVLLGKLGRVMQHRQPSLLVHLGALGARQQGRRGEPENTWTKEIIIIWSSNNVLKVECVNAERWNAKLLALGVHK